MERKRERPDYVENYPKPPYSEVKYIKGAWYLYGRHTEYDPVKKGPVKKNDGIIGKLTPDGLVPSKHRKKKADVPSGEDGTDPQTEVAGETNEAEDCNEAEARRQTGSYTPGIADLLRSPSVEVGAVNFLYGITESIRLALRFAFPECWKPLYCIVMLRAIHRDGGRFCRIETLYKRSYLSHLYPGLCLSRERISDFLSYIGGRRDAMDTCMRCLMDENEQYVIIDGHRSITFSNKMKTARLGYDSKHRHKRQINVLSFCSVTPGSAGVPTYYRPYSGATNDMKAVEHLLETTDVMPVRPIFLGDKGTGDSKVFQLFQQKNCKFIVGVKRGNNEILQSLPTWNKFDGPFNYHGRAIGHHTLVSGDVKYVTFLDFQLLAAETASISTRNEKKSGTRIRKVARDLDNRKKRLEAERKRLTRKEKAQQGARAALESAESTVGKAIAAVEAAEGKLEQAQTALSRKQTSLGSARSANNRTYWEDQVTRAEDRVERERTNLERRERNLVEARSDVEKREAAVREAEEEVVTCRSSIADLEVSVTWCQKYLDRLIAEANGNTSTQSDCEETGDGPGGDSREDIVLNREDTLRRITPETGTFTVETNCMDMSAEDIFLAYKQRPNIEEFFKVYDDTLGFNSSYMRSPETEDAWLFLNQLSSRISMMTLDCLSSCGRTKDTSYLTLMDTLSAIRGTFHDDTWYIEPIESPVAELCRDMGFTPDQMATEKF